MPSASPLDFAVCGFGFGVWDSISLRSPPWPWTCNDYDLSASGLLSVFRSQRWASPPPSFPPPIHTGLSFNITVTIQSLTPNYICVGALYLPSWPLFSQPPSHTARRRRQRAKLCAGSTKKMSSAFPGPSPFLKPLLVRPQFQFHFSKEASWLHKCPPPPPHHPR